MKIANIETIPLQIPLTAGGKSDAGTWGGKDLRTVDSLIVKVTTDDGVVGWGETFGFTAIPAVKVTIDSILAPAIIGKDATLKEKLIRPRSCARSICAGSKSPFGHRRTMRASRKFAPKAVYMIASITPNGDAQYITGEL